MPWNRLGIWKLARDHVNPLGSSNDNPAVQEGVFMLSAAERQDRFGPLSSLVT